MCRQTKDIVHSFIERGRNLAYYTKAIELLLFVKNTMIDITSEKCGHLHHETQTSHIMDKAGCYRQLIAYFNEECIKPLKENYSHQHSPCYAFWEALKQNNAKEPHTKLTMIHIHESIYATCFFE